MSKLSTLLVTHPSALGHDMGPGHPERPDRFRAVEQALGDSAFDGLTRAEAPEASREAIGLVHPAAYVDLLIDAPIGGRSIIRIDGDTAMNAGTVPALLHAAGGAMLAVDEVFARRVDNAFVAMRPPGHHAERDTAMGFCFFNHAAIAARYAQSRHGATRVAIIDFDVHHGNGTQDIFWADPTVLYASTHQMPLYPGTGALSEAGEHETIVNAPLRAGDDGVAFREAFASRILPRVEAFSPDLIVISAGFDAHYRDPLAQLRLVEDDFAWATLQLMAVAERRCSGRIVSLLEGGYDLQGLALSVAAHVGALMGKAS